MNPPKILFEDEFLVAFDKPSGLPVSQGRGERGGATLLGLARGAFGQSTANVHRLDTEASGVVLFARTKAALDSLSGQFQSKSVRRIYGALAALGGGPSAAGAPARDPAGRLPEEFTVDMAVGEDEGVPGKMRVFRKRGGRPSVTEFRILASFGRFAWIECIPMTGRMHQIRVHLAFAGAPVLNDPLYGDPGDALLLSEFKRGYKGREEERPLISRMALHAGMLGFEHPAGTGPLEISAPLPKDLEIALKYLRKFTGGARGPGVRAGASRSSG